jgi:hypothetical protein
LRTYRNKFWRVAGTAFVVFGTVALVDAVTMVLVIDRHVSRPIGAALASTAAAVFAMAGVVVYAGILPLRRLCTADVILATATAIGVALFVVPGVIVFTMWSLVGPVITIEDRPARAALARSWRLVRPHFWLTFALVTLPIQLEHAVLHAVEYAEVFEHPALPALLLNGALGMVVGSVVGLVEVVLAYELIFRMPDVDDGPELALRP